MASSSTVVKRGPGRPSQKSNINYTLRGVCDAPEHEDNRMELAYFDFTAWKSLFNILKGFKAKDIFFRFRKGDVCIFSKDNLGNGILVKLNCNNAIHYYFDESLDSLTLCMYRENLDKLFSTPTKSIDKVLLSYDDDTENIVVTFHDVLLSKVKSRKVAVSTMDISIDLLAVEQLLTSTHIYLSFDLPTKDFKEMLADANNHTEKVSIEKINETSPLEFKYLSNHSTPSSDHYNDNSKINLHQELNGVEYFKCLLCTAPLKALTSSSVLKKIKISCAADDVVHIHTNIGDFFDVFILTSNSQSRT